MSGEDRKRKECLGLSVQAMLFSCGTLLLLFLSAKGGEVECSKYFHIRWDCVLQATNTNGQVCALLTACFGGDAGIQIKTDLKNSCPILS